MMHEGKRVAPTVRGGGQQGLDRFSLRSLPIFTCQRVIILTSLSNWLDIAYDVQTYDIHVGKAQLVWLTVSILQRQVQLEH